MKYWTHPPIPRDQMLRVGDVVTTPGTGECVVFGLDCHWCLGIIPRLASERWVIFGYLSRRMGASEVVRRGDFEAAARAWRRLGWEKLNALRRARIQRVKGIHRAAAAKYERRAALILDRLCKDSAPRPPRLRGEGVPA